MQEVSIIGMLGTTGGHKLLVTMDVVCCEYIALPAGRQQLELPFGSVSICGFSVHVMFHNTKCNVVVVPSHALILSQSP